MNTATTAIPVSADGRHWTINWRKPLAISAIALAALVPVGAIVGYSMQGSEDVTRSVSRSSSSGSKTASEQVVDGDLSASAPQATTEDEAARVGSAGTTRSSSTAAVEPSIIRTGDISLEVDGENFQSSYGQVSTIAMALGGSVVASQSEIVEDREDGETKQLHRGYVTVKVPSDKYEDALSQFRQLGSVTAENSSSSDVTGQVIDLQARITTLQAQEEVYRGLLVQAQSIDDVLLVQQQLTQVRSEIESYQSQLAYLQDATAYSTITVQLEEPGLPSVTESGEKSILGQSVSSAAAAFLTVIGGMVVVVAAVAPFVMVLALVGLAFKLLSRRGPRGQAATAA